MKKFVFILVLFFLSTEFVLAQQTEVRWNRWQPTYEDLRSWRLAYLKLAHEFANGSSKDFLAYEDFSEKIKALKIEKQLPKTFGGLRRLFLKQTIIEHQDGFTLFSEQYAPAFIDELLAWKDQLASSELPSATIRSSMATTYCKTLAEQVVKEFLIQSEQYELRQKLLLPLATLLKSDPAWYIRNDLLTPIFGYQLFRGSPFELDLLEMMVSDPDYRVRLRLLEFFQSITFSRTLLSTALLQIIEEDAHPRVKAKAHEFLRELAKRQVPEALESLDGGTRGIQEEVLLASPDPEFEPQPESEPLSKKIKGSTRRFRKPKDILTKILALQKEVAPSQIPLSEIDPKLIPFLNDLIFSKTQPLYVRITALELLFYYEEEMIPILKNLLLSDSDQIPDNLKLCALNTIGKDLPAELVPIVKKLAYDAEEEKEGGESLVIKINTVRRIAHKTLVRYRKAHPADELSEAIETGQERIDLIATKAQEIISPDPDHFTRRILDLMDGKEWTARNVVEALRNTRKYSMVEPLEKTDQWLQALHQEKILKEIIGIKEYSFEKLRPLIIRALEKDIRKIR